MEDRVINENTLARVQELAASMEAGDEVKAAELLDELTIQREKALYQELGKLTREFHDALKSFQLDARLSDIAEEEIPDARERLNYVLSMTDKAADRTLTAVEASLPLCDALSEQSASLCGDWERFTNRDMGAQEFRELSARLKHFLNNSNETVDTLRTNLNEVLMAQDFQDLTGQIIKRVVTMVEELEASLVNLIRISGQKLRDESPGQAKSKPAGEKDITAEGPPVPGVGGAEVVSGQDEVDDLLSSLGF